MGEPHNYNRRSLEVAIQNVKNTRSFYKTNDAYESALVHFQTGLKLFY